MLSGAEAKLPFYLPPHTLDTWDEFVADDGTATFWVSPTSSKKKPWRVNFDIEWNESDAKKRHVRRVLLCVVETAGQEFATNTGLYLFTDGDRTL